VFSNRPESFKMMRLFDINENKEYATYADGGTCFVDDSRCASEQQFKQLIERYMQN
jgi:hypothetical protein